MNSLIFVKTDIQTALEKGIKTVAIPKYENDVELFKKIKLGDFKASITQPRNYEFHKKIFAIAKLCIEKDVFNVLSDIIFEKTEKLIENYYISIIRMRENNDAYAFIYIMKFLFLPLDSEILPNGTEQFKVASINFEKMDNIQFQEFFNKVIDLLLDFIGCNLKELEENLKRYY